MKIVCPDLSQVFFFFFFYSIIILIINYVGSTYFLNISHLVVTSKVNFQFKVSLILVFKSSTMVIFIICAH
jgi:hypothetical protein